MVESDALCPEVPQAVAHVSPGLEPPSDRTRAGRAGLPWGHNFILKVSSLVMLRRLQEADLLGRSLGVAA